MTTVELEQTCGKPLARRWLWLALLGVCLLICALSKPFLSLDSWAEFESELLGWLCFSVGAMGRWWCAIYLSAEAPGSLVTSGPYSICRNPRLIANFLLGTSFVCILGSVTFLLAYLLLFAIYSAIALACEERRLAAEFREPYAQYRRDVPRLWPRPSLFKSPGALAVAAARLRPELWRTLFWIWLPILGKVLAQLRAESWWPKFFGLP